MDDVSHWEAAGRRLEIAGHELFVIDAGPRQPDALATAPLLLLHGFPTSSWDFHELWSELSAERRVVAFDFLGFGFSAKPRRHTYTLMEQADLAEGVLAALGVHEVGVLAHDYGVTVAQELLARGLEREQLGPAAVGPGPRLAYVAFLNGGLFPELHRPRPIQRLLASPLGGLLARAVRRARFARSLSAVFGPDTQPSPEELDAFWSIVTRDGGHRITHRLIRYMGERRTHRARWVGALEHTRVPLRLINGALDPVSGRHVADHYRAHVPRADVVVLEHIGHYPQVEDPDGVLANLLPFVRRHERLRALGAPVA